MHGAWKGAWQLAETFVKAPKPFRKVNYATFCASSLSVSQVSSPSGHLVLHLGTVCLTVQTPEDIPLIS